MDQKIGANFTVILLAAGYGSRISDVTNSPKCLLEVNGKSLLERNFHIWSNLGIKNIHIVLGYQAQEIQNFCKKYEDNLNITFSYNEEYRTKGNTYSLLYGLEKVINDSKNILIFDADLIYDLKILQNFLQDPLENQILVGSASIDDIECAKVIVNNKGLISKTIDKRAITPEELLNSRFIGEAIGILKFNLHNAKKLLEYSVAFLQDSSNHLKNWEHVLNTFLPSVEVLPHMLEDHLPWVEIDNQEDYNVAKDLFGL